MRRILTLFSLVLAIALVAAACGDDDSSTEAGSDAGDTPIDDAPDDTTDDLRADDADDDEVPSDTEPTDAEPPLGAGPYPIADIFVAYFDGAGNNVEYRLSCLGDTATFTGDVPAGVDAATACLSIDTDEARMLLDPSVPIDRACTEIYGGPEIATVGGLLDDLEVDYEISRTNGCGIDDWERVFAGLVPPPAA